MITLDFLFLTLFNFLVKFVNKIGAIKRFNSAIISSGVLVVPEKKLSLTSFCEGICCVNLFERIGGCCVIDLCRPVSCEGVKSYLLRLKFRFLVIAASSAYLLLCNRV